MQWTIDQVAKRFEEAVDVLQILPDQGRLGYARRWPITLYLEREIERQTPTRMHLRATPQQVTRMEETLTWITWVEPATRHLIWRRAEGLPWRVIGRQMGLDKSTAHRRWKKGLQVMADKLEKQAQKKQQTDPLLCVV